jgi:hypothetical protein
MVFRKLAPLALLGLAACSQPEGEPDAPVPTATPASSAAIAAPETDVQPAAGTIPITYRGAWDWTGGTCAPASDLRMEIGAQSITFYESVGTVEAVREDGDTLSLDLAMEGEGEQWRQTTVLRLVDGGTLLDTGHDDPSATGPMRLKRCPGENTAQ